MADQSGNELILLGAGASIEAGVPPAVTMTQRMMEQFQAAGTRKNAQALAYIIGGLMFGYAKQGISPYLVSVNVEDVFNAVDLLAKRNKLEAAPFIASWDSLVEEIDQYQPDAKATEALFNQIFKQVDVKINIAITNLIRDLQKKRPIFKHIG